MASKLGFATSHGRELVTRFLDRLVRSGLLKKSDKGGYLLPQAATAPSQALSEASSHVLSRFSQAGMSVLPLAELEQDVATRFKLGSKELKAIVKHLVDERELIAIDDIYLPKQLVERCRAQLIEYLAVHPQGISVAEYRDLVQGNRRICLGLLTLCDREGLTRRDGDLRHLTDKGRKLIAEA